MKTQPTTPSVPSFSYVVGFVVGFLVPIVIELLVVGDITWSSFLAIFTGLLGAILGGYVVVFLKPAGPERKKLTDSLFQTLCIIVGVIVAFWIPAVITVMVAITRLDGENAILSLIYGLCAGSLITPLGALAGKSVAQYLLKVWSEKDSSH